MSEPMNERLQELLDLFLHRGCTPEEERELFDSCLHDPLAAETVRQQLLLSLKIRKLRDETGVPVELRNELFRKINALAAESPAPRSRRSAFAWLGGLRLGWSHAVVAGAAAALAVFVMMNNDADDVAKMPTQSITGVIDTVRLYSVDTVHQVEVRNVRVPVYMERPSIALDASADVKQTDETITAPGTQPGDALADRMQLTPEDKLGNGLAQVRDIEVSRGDFLKQYSEMVANAGRIQLTEDDRVRL